MQHALAERSVQVRILFGFVQVLSRLNVSYRVHLPASVVQFLQTLAYLEIFEFTAFFGGLHCLVSNFSYIERV